MDDFVLTVLAALVFTGILMAVYRYLRYRSTLGYDGKDSLSIRPCFPFLNVSEWKEKEGLVHIPVWAHVKKTKSSFSHDLVSDEKI